MRFVIVNPFTRNITPVNCPDQRDAYKVADLKPLEIDHGVVVPGVGIVVYEYGLFMSPDMQAYFTIGGRLYAGNAVLYGFNHRGETIDLTEWPAIAFLPSVEAVERSIELGLIERPRMTANGALLWQWPNPAPKGMMP